MAIDLTDKEQAILNAACVRIEMAQRDAEATKRAAEQAARQLDIFGHEARGVLRSILELGDRNPAAHQVNWDGVNATITELPVAPADAGTDGAA